MLTAGIDIGSRSSKAVIVANRKLISYAISLETHLSVSDRGLLVFEEALKGTPYSRQDVESICATGYGRICAPYADTTVTEITCHAKGMHTLVPSVRTLIDIGGQDSKVIKLNSNGEIIDFTMNDRCAAGTGKFLEITAKAMNLSLDAFSTLFFESKNPKPVSSMCTVFAESEVISLLADNVAPKDIVAGLVQAVARRVGNMATRLGIVEDLVFSGGVAKNKGVRRALETVTGHKFRDFNFDPQLVGAFGAAILAQEEKKPSFKKKVRTLLSIDNLHRLLEERPGEITALREQGRKTVGYFCSYVPEEILHALDFIPLRLARGGNVDVANAGNAYLTANACPYAASCVGFKEKNQDFYFAHTDIVADATSCYQMKRVLEVWEHYFNAKVINIGLPRTFYEPSGPEYFKITLTHFVDELEQIGGKKLSQESLAASVRLFNDIRDAQRTAYRLLRTNQVGWSELIQFIQAGFVLDRVKYLEVLQQFVEEASSTIAPLNESLDVPSIRILLAGSMIAPGDQKLAGILDELGLAISMDELCAGSRGTYRHIKHASIEDIAYTYLANVPCGAFPYPDSRADPRLNHLEQLIQQYSIQGVLYYTLRFCDAYSFKAKQIETLCQKIGIPLLHLHTDYAASDKGQLTTRIEAFKEAISSKTEKAA